MRILFVFISLIIVVFFILQGRLNMRSSEKPVFMQTDTISINHQTKIEIKVHSIYRPDSFQQSMLKIDYSNIWAHLNYLYQTNDVEKGKEYYSEKWFRQISNHYTGVINNPIKRQDQKHELHIMSWAEDGLICNVIDSNILLQHTLPNQTSKISKHHMAFSLVYQGDHWRVDAMKILK